MLAHSSIFIIPATHIALIEVLYWNDIYVLDFAALYPCVYGSMSIVCVYLCICVSVCP